MYVICPDWYNEDATVLVLPMDHPSMELEFWSIVSVVKGG